MPHSCVWNDLAFTCVKRLSYVWNNCHMYDKTCLIHVCEMTWRVWLDSFMCMTRLIHMGWLQLVGSIKLQVSFAKEPYKRDDILQERHIILSILLSVATPYVFHDSFICVTWLFHMRAMPHSYEWHDSFICVPWLIHMCDMTCQHPQCRLQNRLYKLTIGLTFEK